MIHRLKVDNLPLDLKLGDLQNIFTDAISVTKPVREVDPLSGDVRAYAYILFSSTEDAAEVLQASQGQVIGGHEIRLQYRQFSSYR